MFTWSLLHQQEVKAVEYTVCKSVVHTVLSNLYRYQMAKLIHDNDIIGIFIENLKEGAISQINFKLSLLCVFSLFWRITLKI